MHFKFKISLIFGLLISKTICYHILVPTRSSRVRSLAATIDDSTDILRRVDMWACVKGCGACCKLGPMNSRPDLSSYLTAEELKMYESMIAEDDWCKHFDKTNRMCTIYDKRPEFCIVNPQKYKKMFDVEEEELNDFCSFCCREQISDVYGVKSVEMTKFNDVNKEINKNNPNYEDWSPDDETNDEEYETIDIDPSIPAPPGLYV